MAMQTIEVDDEVYAELKEHAEPFEDTPNTVLRRILGVDGTRSSARAKPTASSSPARRNGRSRRRLGRRAPAGSLLPETEYELPILKALADSGGRAPTREVVEAVGEMVADRLTDLDQEELKSGGPRWQNRVQFARLRMVEQGLLVKDSPRGLWEITDQGRAALNGAA